MNLRTLINKSVDTVKFIMAQPTMIFRNKESITLLNDAHIVDSDECARPDLIALQYYGNQSMLDMILKWNGISNPFSINEGDILEIPSANTNFFKLERPKELENNPVKDQFVDGKRLSKKDQRRLDALKKKYGKDNLLPPNVIPVGKKNYEFVGTRIRMGAQVQTDDVVNGINSNLDGINSNLDGINSNLDGINSNLGDANTDGNTIGLDQTTIEFGGENTGDVFKKIPGGVWIWNGSMWTPVNPDVAQEVAGSLYGEYGSPNGTIEGSFEGQLYFDKLRDNDTGGNIEGQLNNGQGNNNAGGPAGASGASGTGASGASGTGASGTGASGASGTGASGASGASGQGTGNTGGNSLSSIEDQLNNGQGNNNAGGPVGTSGASGQSADNTGGNNNDGGNPAGGNNTNNGTTGTGNSSTSLCGQ